MMKIKVLHIIKSLGRGGAEMLLPETLALHDKERYEFHYIYFLPWKDQMEGDLIKKGGTVTCIGAQNNLSLLSKFKEVERYCEENKIDIIHAHLPWSGFLSRIVHKRIGIPLIYTEHNIQERYHFITRKLNALTFNWQSSAIGVSKDVSNSIKRNIKPGIPVHTILNGVNTNKFKRDHALGDKIREIHNIPKEIPLIGNIAVFREQKDLKCWVKAFKIIKNSNPEAYGILVGSGPMEEEIKQLIKDQNLENHIVLPGLKTNTLEYFSGMDVFMLSSQFEGLPIALLEAMSSGCAIVSTMAGGVVEAVRDKQDGLLSEVGNHYQLASNCNTLLNNIETRNNYQKAARKRVEESFSLTNMVKQLEMSYTQLYEAE